MHFGHIPIDEAEGVILAHSLTVGTRVIKKGRVLTAEDVRALRDSGTTTIMAARLITSDITEDKAAARIAQALAGDHVTVSAPFTGRCNIYAACDGVAHLDAVALAALNAEHESITVATLMPYERVTSGQMLATIKIIPFAVPSDVMAAAEANIANSRSSRDNAAITVAAFGATAAALILTELPATKKTVIDKRIRVIADRLAARGATIAHTVTVPHTETAVAAAIQAAADQGHSPVLVFAASAIVDRGDVIPAALVRAGGQITRLGMPVDPGNLLLLGSLRTTSVIGIPSCAASPKLNGFDWVLDRVIAGLSISSRYIADMGVGGLLKEIPTRPQPRDGVTPSAGSAEPLRRAPRLACIVLAAGRSTRMGATNKLLEVVQGQPLVRHAVMAACGSIAATVVVVTGHQAGDVTRALDGLDCHIVENPDYASGLAGSLRVGLDALALDIDGAFVLLGDMPEVTSADLSQLAAAFDPAENRAIVRPMRHGQRGNPVLWARQFFDDMRQSTGDVGAKDLMSRHGRQSVDVEMTSDAVLADVDTPDALAALRQRQAASELE
jgi:molybdenum cofactor cytidylyltransferase